MSGTAQGQGVVIRGEYRQVCLQLWCLSYTVPGRSANQKRVQGLGLRCKDIREPLLAWSASPLLASSASASRPHGVRAAGTLGSTAGGHLFQ